MNRILARLRALFRKGKLDRDMAEEMRFHLAQRAADNIDDGMQADEAHYAALRAFGGVEQIKERAREERGWRWIEDAIQDVRYAVRTLCKSRGFFATVLVSLALGIGATTAVFSIADAVLFRSLPVREPDELVMARWVSGPNPPINYLSGEFSHDGRGKQIVGAAFSHVAFSAMRDQQQTLATIFASAALPRLSAVIDGQAEHVNAHLVSGDYFSGLGLGAEAGRLISAADDRPGAAAVAVISHSYWQRRFLGSQAVVGRTFLLNGITCTLIGISPQPFAGTLQFGAPPDVFIPLTLQAELMPRERLLDDPAAWWVQIMGRLSPGVERASARADLARIFSVGIHDHGVGPRSPDLPELKLESGRQGLTGRRNDQRQPLVVIMSVALLILGIGCSSAAGLVLARSYRREKEMGVRLAIGATRGRLFRLMLAEGAVLGVLSGGLGLCIARWSVDFLAARVLPAGAPPIAIDARMLFLASVVSLVAMVAATLLPAYHIAGASTCESLKREGQSESNRRSLSRWGGAIVAAQIAVSFVLLIAATLLLRTLTNLKNSNSGIDERQLTICKLDLNQAGSPQQRRAALEEISRRIAALPGVKAVGFSRHHLLGDNVTKVRVAVGSAGDPRAEVVVHANWVTSGFFEATGIPRLAGRIFDQRDENSKAIIVNEAFVRSFAADEEPIGKLFSIGEIVGVAADTKYANVRDNPPPTIFFPYKSDSGDSAVAMTVRGDYRGISAGIPNMVREVSPSVTVFDLKTFAAQREDTIRADRAVAQITSFLGGLAAVITLVGVFGLLSCFVAARRREIAVRIALGSTSAAVLRLVFRNAFLVSLIGISCGAVGALLSMTVLQGTLFGVTARDPLMYLAVGLGLAGAIAVATWIPAWRASRINPMVALRSE